MSERRDVPRVELQTASDLRLKDVGERRRQRRRKGAAGEVRWVLSEGRERRAGGLIWGRRRIAG